MAEYIPVRTTTRKDCQALHNVYKKAKTSLGKGSFGEVYEACIRANKDCGYVLKVITYDHKKFSQKGGKSLERYYREWTNEAEVFCRLNELQVQLELVFSPKLYDRWFCNKKGKVYFYLLMEKYDGDLSHLAESMSERNVVISMALERMVPYLTLIHQNLNICLNDVNPRNILYKRIGKNGYQLVFSDFGIATQDTDEECIKVDRDNLKALINNFNFS